MVSDQQIERYEGDPWEKVIAPWLEACTSTSISEVVSVGHQHRAQSTRPSAADGGCLSLGCGTIAFQIPIDEISAGEVTRFHRLMPLIEVSSTSKGTRSVRK
jgi:hypothetical protein